MGLHGGPSSIPQQSGNFHKLRICELLRESTILLFPNRTKQIANSLHITSSTQLGDRKSIRLWDIDKCIKPATTEQGHKNENLLPPKKMLTPTRGRRHPEQKPGHQICTHPVWGRDVPGLALGGDSSRKSGSGQGWVGGVRIRGIS